jgi:hypothetical protein
MPGIMSGYFFVYIVYYRGIKLGEEEVYARTKKTELLELSGYYN